jgi:hypothetical protein
MAERGGHPLAKVLTGEVDINPDIPEPEVQRSEAGVAGSQLESFGEPLEASP